MFMTTYGGVMIVSIMIFNTVILLAFMFTVATLLTICSIKCWRWLRRLLRGNDSLPVNEVKGAIKIPKTQTV